MRIGLTGGIGSGKSVVARRLVERGAVLIDSDVLAREVLEPGTPGLAQVVDRFGEGVLDAEGRLDRAALAAIVFPDPGARADLEAITHPLIRARSAEIEAAAPPGAVVVHDIPLLVEKQMGAGFDLVVVVGADEQTRLDRLVRLRGMDPEAALARIRAQADDDARRAAADVWLDNSADLSSLLDQLDRLWDRIQGRHQTGTAEGTEEGLGEGTVRPRG